MNFLLEPIEPGADFDQLLVEATAVECNTGYACVVGKVTF